MTDFYIFRHGDTKDSGSLITRFIGRSGDTRKLPIIPKSFPALERIGAFLKNIPTDADFCSPFVRCVTSAEIVGKISGKTYKKDSRIAEFEKNGEKFSHLNARVRDFLTEIEQEKYSSVSICTHGAVISALKHLATNGKFHFFQIWDFPSPGNLVIIKGKKIE